MKLLSDLSSQWAVINQLLDQALALDPSEHEAWLERLAPEHHGLKGTLRGLLAAQPGIESVAFLDTLPKMSEAAPELKAGDEIGPYRILDRIGSGGQGSVWLAQRADGQLKRKLALKLPQLAWAEGLAVRMERERDILGALDHPYIARLYDAGVDQRGRPFLAIEYIEGVSLDRFCDEQPLDRWRSANPDASRDDLLRVGIARLEWSQSFADADEVLRLLSQEPWSALTGEDDSEWPFYPLWHRGLALERQGDRASALSLLEAAVRKAQDVMGVDHPRVALVRLSLSFARWRGGWMEDPVTRSALVNQMSGVVADLEHAMPPEALAVREARVFLAHLRGAPATTEALDRWRNPQATFYP